MQSLIKQLEARFPALRFTPGQQFSWSPETGEIFYKQAADNVTGAWSLLHETGHALLGHTSYKADFELLKLEVEAWDQARTLGTALGIRIDEDHIQDCLDTYRDWLHKRSLCPTCQTRGLQQADAKHYRCYNCHTMWRVTPNRFSRVYRSTKLAATNLMDESDLNVT